MLENCHQSRSDFDVRTIGVFGKLNQVLLKVTVRFRLICNKILSRIIGLLFGDNFGIWIVSGDVFVCSYTAGKC